MCKHEISLLESCLDSKVLDTSSKGSVWQMEVEFILSFSLFCVACEVLLRDSVLFWFGLQYSLFCVCEIIEVVVFKVGLSCKSVLFWFRLYLPPPP